MIDLYHILYSLSKSVDIIHKNFENHSKQVAYLSLYLAEAINYNIDKNELFKAALVHDVGAIFLRSANINGIFEEKPEDLKSHEQFGHNLLKNFEFFKKTAEIVLYHHTDFKNNNTNNLYSQLINLADRICAIFSLNTKKVVDIPNTKIKINNYLKDNRDGKFNPHMIEAFYDSIYGKNEVWINLLDVVNLKYKKLSSLFDLKPLNVSLDEGMFLFSFFGEVINSHSSFTLYHSERVFKVSNLLCNELGFSNEEAQPIQIASYLHDLGKLAVPIEVLDKRGYLSNEEHDLIKIHPLITEKVLSEIENFQDIVVYASYHHEFLDGSGYPYGKRDYEIPLGARIVTIADMVASFLEHRPYRYALSIEETKTNLQNLAHYNKLDKDLVNYLFKNPYIFEEIIQIDQQRMTI